MANVLKIAVIGSGPAGLSAAARAAETGVSHVLLEAQAHLSNTIFRYQKGKHVMAEPEVLPLRSPLGFAAGTREEVLTTWNSGIKQVKANVYYQNEVLSLQKEGAHFRLRIKGGGEVAAENVVLAIGLQGNLRKLGVPGEDLPFVQYQLDDPDEYEDESIVVVGAGDAAIENALALARQNNVIIINRRDEFARAKTANESAILKAIEDGQIECYYNTDVGSVVTTEGADKRGRIVLNTTDGVAEIEIDRVIARLGAIPPRRFVESCGVVFPNEDPAAVPAIKPNYESNVPGLYIIGALAGYPLIKQAMNQGYEVVEFIQGNAVEPADEPLLRGKFKAMPGFRSVTEALGRVQRNVPLLASITPLQLREFMLDSEVRTPAPGEVVFERNDYTNTFFCIVEGEVEIVIDPASGKFITVRAGEFFGEVSLISGRRRSATARAGKGCVLIETPRRTMNKLINSVDAVKRVVDEAFIMSLIRSRFAPDTPSEKLADIASAATIERFRAGEVLFEEGEPGDCVHLVRVGSLTISRNIGGREVVLSYVPAGNYVGEMALLGDNVRSASAKAAIATETIRLDGSVFKQLLLREPELRLRLQAEYRQRAAANLKMQAQPEGGDVISFLVSQGVGEATDILLIDEALCVRCDNCEKACAETHGGTSRLNREAGPTYATVHVPTSCRHCEHPHCMKDCPPDAIKRAPNGEVFIADNCIGCGNCERNCPYGVIHMAAQMPRKPGIVQWLLFGRGPGPGEDPKGKPRATGGKKAVKCDMCRDLAGGPACVRSCPTGAAIRINPEDLPSYAQSLR